MVRFSPILFLLSAFIIDACSKDQNPVSPPSNSTVLLSEDFEATSEGNFPTTLERQWESELDASGNAVGTDQHHSGGKALRLSADPSGCYGSAAKFHLATVPDKISVEFQMLCEGNYAGGCHEEEGLVEFINEFVGPNADTRGGLGFHESSGRTFRLIDSITAISWQPMTWYKVTVKFDKTARIMTAYVNDTLVAERTTSQSDYHYLVFGSGDATVWIDDVKITQE